MRILIGVMACLFAAHAFAAGKIVLAVKTGDRAQQEQLLREATTLEVNHRVVINVCGAGMTMLHNRNIEANVLLENAEASGAKIRVCKGLIGRRRTRLGYE